MSLVAYGSSDESEEESDEVKCLEDVSPYVQLSPPSKGIDLGLADSCRSKPVFKDNSHTVDQSLGKNETFSSKSETTRQPIFKGLPKPKYNISEGIGEDQQLKSDLQPHAGIFAFLPVPKSSSSFLTMVLDNRKDINKKVGVKITLPSLSEFNYEEEHEPVKKKLKPSQKGSGLFAILPAPKNTRSKETQRPLIPHVLTKKSGTPPLQRKDIELIKAAKDSISPGLGTYSVVGLEDESEGDEEKDFFSLNSDHKLSSAVISSDSLLVMGPDVPSIDHLQSHIHPKEEPLAFDSGFQPSPWASGPPLPGPNRYSSPNWQGSRENCEEQSTSQGPSNHISFPQENLQLDAEAMQRLCGRRSKNQQQPVEFIDVDGTEIMPDPNDWLVKQLSEEKPKMRSHSHKRNDGPTTQQRRKHQITYLAFQAKENELELKNQWSQNRMSRKQTQSKYGF